MKNKKLEANLSMAVSKVFSGLNMNALKYLLPLWMSPLTGATLRCTFAAAAFWVIGWFMPPEKSSAKDKWLLFLFGHHQCMSLYQRIDIEKRKKLFVFRHLVAGDFACDDSTEYCCHNFY